jgi:hypothetical protein
VFRQVHAQNGGVNRQAHLAHPRFRGLAATTAPVAPIPNRAIVGRLAILGTLSMANVHGSLGAPLQTRPDVERETGGGRVRLTPCR